MPQDKGILDADEKERTVTTMKDDTISRQALLDAVDGVPWYHQNKNGEMVHGASDKEQAWYKAENIYKAIENVPPTQPNLSEAYSKAVFTWLMDYQIRAAELKGRYTPYEVLSWVINDWRKEWEGGQDDH